MVAGINNDLTITIELGATTPTLSTTSPYSPADKRLFIVLELVSDVNHFSPVMSWNHQTVQYAVVGSFNPYQLMVNQLVTLTGLTDGAGPLPARGGDSPRRLPACCRPAPIRPATTSARSTR